MNYAIFYYIMLCYYCPMVTDAVVAAAAAVGGGDAAKCARGTDTRGVRWQQSWRKPSCGRNSTTTGVIVIYTTIVRF